MHELPALTQDEYADASDPLPEGLIGNLKEFHVSYTEVKRGRVKFVDIFPAFN